MSTARFRAASEKLAQAIMIDGGNAYIVDPQVRQRALAVFARESAADWKAMAGSILRHWKTGPDVDVEDVNQELLTAAVHYSTRYIPGLGTTFADFLVFNAMARAKKRVHKARGAKLHGNPDSHHSNLPIHLEDIMTRGDAPAATPRSMIAADAEAAFFSLKRLQRARVRVEKYCNPQETLAFNALDEHDGDITAAAGALTRDLIVRLTGGFRTEEIARAIITKTLAKLNRALDAEGA